LPSFSRSKSKEEEWASEDEFFDIESIIEER
jgi:serine/threonine protein kinase